MKCNSVFGNVVERWTRLTTEVVVWMVDKEWIRTRRWTRGGHVAVTRGYVKCGSYMFRRLTVVRVRVILQTQSGPNAIHIYSFHTQI